MNPVTNESLKLDGIWKISWFGKLTEHVQSNARAYHRTLKLTRTIADLANSEEILTIYIAEAIHYRRYDSNS